MKRGLWLGVAVGLLVIVASDGYAKTVPPEGSPELQSPPQASGWVVVEKLGRGLGNIAFGWVELPGTIQQQYREHDAPASFFSGLFMGFFKAVGRTAVGVFETVTFVIPHQPILPPLTYFKQEHPDWKLPQR